MPCELWFFNRDKPEAHLDKVLMIDARNVYRQVTRKICDFSPEQQQNLLAIVWLYRGESERFVELVVRYCDRVFDEGKGCFSTKDERGLPNFLAKLNSLREVLVPFLDTLGAEGAHAEASEKLAKAVRDFEADGEALQKAVFARREAWTGTGN